MTTSVRTLGVMVTLALTAVLVACAPPAPPDAPAAVEQVVSITNQRRAENGLSPLRNEELLNWASQRHSNDQAAMNQMSHTGSDGSNAGQRITREGYAWSAWGENVAWGYRDAATVMNAWMGSQGHRDNILNPNFTDIGVGLAYASNGTPYWTMVLARPG